MSRSKRNAKAEEYFRRAPNYSAAGRIWVNSCVVNPTAIGTVNKDYRIV